LPTRSPLTSNQSLPFTAQLGVDVGSLVVQHSEPVVQQHGRFAPRRNASASTASTARGTIGIDVVAQQYALH
jgi:hypothetical protein